ncbi:MAG: hypothetical protein LR015_15755 [Verrucomicrobia bacterium]|nr:hypothetical protein [Verrucomicrobiota bacterium]
MNLFKIITTSVLLAGSVAVASAATPPNFSIDPNTGALILLDAQGNETGRFEIPQATVNNDGALVVGGQTIARPDATVDSETGDLIVGGERIPAPTTLPPSGNILDAIFGDTLSNYLNHPNPGEIDGWYFSYNLRFVFHYGESAPDYVYIERSARFSTFHLTVLLS